MRYDSRLLCYCILLVSCNYSCVSALTDFNDNLEKAADGFVTKQELKYTTVHPQSITQSSDSIYEITEEEYKEFSESGQKINEPIVVIKEVKKEEMIEFFEADSVPKEGYAKKKTLELHPNIDFTKNNIKVCFDKDKNLDINLSILLSPIVDAKLKQELIFKGYVLDVFLGKNLYETVSLENYQLKQSKQQDSTFAYFISVKQKVFFQNRIDSLKELKNKYEIKKLKRLIKDSLCIKIREKNTQSDFKEVEKVGKCNENIFIRLKNVFKKTKP